MDDAVSTRTSCPGAPFFSRLPKRGGGKSIRCSCAHLKLAFFDPGRDCLVSRAHAHGEIAAFAEIKPE